MSIFVCICKPIRKLIRNLSAAAVGETLFREMSLATRMISIYLEMEEGKEYIKGPAAELLNSISSLDFSMDSNPNLFNGERFTNPNVDKIIESAQIFIDKVSTSASKWPPYYLLLLIFYSYFRINLT